MAGAGAPFYMPAFWPASNLAYAAAKPADEKAPKPKALPYLDVWGHMTSVFAVLPKILLAYVVYYYTTYPALGAAKEWAVEWMWPIVARDVIGMFVVAGFWDWFLYFSPARGKMSKYKLNPVYPSTAQIRHDMLWSLSATLTASALEIIMCRWWATGAVPFAATLAAHPWQSAFWLIGCTHVRIIHFYILHRHIHPWGDKHVLGFKVPDVGRFLYRHVHSLHHKSYNPTAFSGTSMHPYESFGYYSAALVPAIFGAHPIAFLACKYDCGIGAWLGHDGFQWPGAGDYFHQLHHKYFECNYGAMHVPIDMWFGTYSEGPTKAKDYDSSSMGYGAHEDGATPAKPAAKAKAKAKASPVKQRQRTPRKR